MLTLASGNDYGQLNYLSNTYYPRISSPITSNYDLLVLAQCCRYKNWQGEGRVGWIADLWVGMYRRGYSIGILVGGRRKVLSPSQCPIKHGNLLSLSFCPWDYAEYVLESTRVLCSSSRDNHNHTTTVGRSVSWSPTIIIIVRWDVHYYPIRAKVVGFCSRETGEDGKWANRRSIRTIGES